MNKIHKLQKGFTLIELMIVVVIVGILTSVAAPAYNQYVLRSRATAATSVLADVRILMEQHFQDNRTYVGGPCAAPAGTDTSLFAYNCSVAPSATAYTLSAAGAGAMAGYQYNIDQNNLKTSTTPDGGGGNCWEVKKGVSC